MAASQWPPEALAEGFANAGADHHGHGKKGSFAARCRAAILGSHLAGPLLYDKFLSMDSLQLHPPYDRHEQTRLHELGYWQERTAKRLRWCMDPLVGLGCAIAAITVQLVTLFFWNLRIQVINHFFEGEAMPWATAYAFLFGSLVALAYTLVAAVGVAWQPQAAASGLPGVIAFLNGCDWQGALTGAVLPVKVFGTALACAAGLAVGPEGPLIHIGTIIGMLTVNWVIRPMLRHLGGSSGAKFERELAREPLRYHFQAAAMGAGAGVAAAFQAPLAGTIFVIEEAASYFSKRLFFHSLITCCCAVLFTIFLSDIIGVRELSLYNATTFCLVEELWSWMLLLQAWQVGVTCGILGSMFNRMVVKLNTMRAMQARRLGGTSGKFMAFRFAEVAAVTVVTTAFAVLSPSLQPCRDASLQNVFAQSSGCIPEEWQNQLVSGSRSVSFNDAFGPLRPHYKVKQDFRQAWIPAVGLFGVQYNPTNCTKAVLLEPRCNITLVLASLPGLRGANLQLQLSDTDYCCGFQSLEILAAGANDSVGHFFSAAHPAAPIKLDPELWPPQVCRGPRTDPANFGIKIPQYSPTAALTLVSPRGVVRNLLTHGPPMFLPVGEVAYFLGGYMILAALSSGIWVPSGLVLPMMIIGACVGRLSGLLWFEALKGSAPDRPTIPWIPELEPLLRRLHPREYDYDMDCGVLAMAGAASFLSGSGSLMLFVVVLILELTWDPFIIPVVLCAMVTARVVASMLGSKGLYHELIEVQSFPFFPEHEHWRQRHWLVKDVLEEDARRQLYFSGGSNWARETDIDLRHVDTSWRRGMSTTTRARDGSGSVTMHHSASQSSMTMDMHVQASLRAEGLPGSPTGTFSGAAAVRAAAGGQRPTVSMPSPASQEEPLFRVTSHTEERAPWQQGTLIYLQRLSSAAEIEKALSTVLDGDEKPMANGFPVVEDERGELCGLVSRPSLEGLLKMLASFHQWSANDPGRRVRHSLSGREPRDSLGRSLVHSYEVDGEVSRTSTRHNTSSTAHDGSPSASSIASPSAVDVGTVMDLSPFTVLETVPVHHAHMLFRQLGLRHLVVVDRYFRPVGILTRKSLMPWRTPWRMESFVGGDSFLETRTQHSPMGSPVMPRWASANGAGSSASG